VNVATVVVLAFKDAERDALVAPLKAAGHRVVVTEPKDPDFRLALRALEAVDVVVVDLSKGAAHGRECAAWVSQQRRFRSVPVLLTGVPDGDEGVTRMKVPFGKRVSAAHIDKAVARAVGSGKQSADSPDESG
jgi:DNA-binding NarL/FixJ family response regulator